MSEIQQFIRFEPILKEKIWGGEKLNKVLHKNSNRKDIGESWEISNVSGNVSLVSNGTLKGTSLTELIKKFTTSLLGEKVYHLFGADFPLLIKFIDAQKPLSIQVHPNDEVAKKRHNSFGKTEMWYVMDSDENADLVVGFKKETNKEEYLYHLENNSLLEILNVDNVKKGDVYFIPAGRVHAIGAGVLLAEIQQTSDITYRIYDWNRKDLQGNSRDLHIKEALDVIDFSFKETYKTIYKSQNNTAKPIVSCPYFTTNILKVTNKIQINHLTKDSFVIYMCVAGEVTFVSGENEEKLSIGQTLMVPASLKSFIINTQQESELLEVYIS